MPARDGPGEGDKQEYAKSKRGGSRQRESRFSVLRECVDSLEDIALIFWNFSALSLGSDLVDRILEAESGLLGELTNAPEMFVAKGPFDRRVDERVNNRNKRRGDLGAALLVVHGSGEAVRGS